MKKEEENELKALDTIMRNGYLYYAEESESTAQTFELGARFDGKTLEALLKTTVLMLNKEAELQERLSYFKTGNDLIICSTSKETYTPPFGEDTYFRNILTPMFRIEADCNRDYARLITKTYKTSMFGSCKIHTSEEMLSTFASQLYKWVIEKLAVSSINCN